MSYFYVGFATCLEWHARSRLVDIIRWNPESVDIKDIKNIRESVILGLVGSSADLAAVIGSSFKVNSFDDYKYPFEKIIKTFKRDEKIIPIMLGDKSSKNANPGGVVEFLEDLFENRHAIVHEIGARQVGHYVLKDRPSAGEMGEIGRKVHEIMVSIELWIAENGSFHFPNRLREDGGSAGEVDRMREWIGLEEVRVLTKIETDKEINDKAAHSWKESIDAYNLFHCKILEFMRESNFFSQRFNPAIRDMEHMIMSMRVEMLKSIEGDI